jgi:di/tricarboxylate transporter
MDRAKLRGLILGVILALVCFALPFDGLTVQGRKALALTVMTVVFWAFQVSHSGYVAGLYLVLLIILKVAKPTVVLAPLATSSTFLIMGAYLLAASVRSSTLGERIAYFMLRFVSSYRSLIIVIYLLTFVLSLIIPHAWPRALLIMSVMLVVIDTAQIGVQDARQIGFAVFASSVPISLIFLTGASITNPLAVQYAQVDLGWIGWLKVMGIPSMVASVLTCILFLLLFKQHEKLSINKQAIQEKYEQLGPLSGKEKRILIWLVIAILSWATDSLHKIDIGWITFLITVLMSFPVIGEVLEARHWKEIPLHMILFITAATAIGKVGAETGMNAYIAHLVLPTHVPTNIFALAAVVTTFTMIVHLLLGSVLSVMGVAIPALLAFAASTSIDPLVIVLWAYTVIGSHYILPFHHMNVLVGVGEGNGLYSQKETIRLGIPLIAVVYFITVVVQTLWWKALGLIA